MIICDAIEGVFKNIPDGIAVEKALHTDILKYGRTYVLQATTTIIFDLDN